MSAHGRHALAGVSAVVGVVVAHSIDYALLHPDPAGRTTELLASGHGYWPVAITCAGVAALASVSGALLGAARRGVRGVRRREDTGLVRSLLWCAGLQIVLFTGMEVFEHAIVGMTPAELARTPEFLLGLVLQLLVAGILVTILFTLELSVERVARQLRAVPPSPSRPCHPPRFGRWVRRAAVVPMARPRGPPAPLPV